MNLLFKTIIGVSIGHSIYRFRIIRYCYIARRPSGGLKVDNIRTNEKLHHHSSMEISIMANI